ncbi:L-ribulose-5-phosphate 4-epimerase AraD [candidate division KSB1 bacterium]|nr:L-ribulose-5-phosphate 4-epimerase AraD [candidate division KSB1 bacterium]RQW09977.1 MAG: L-ribulose-5-phosphate 4-epimerase AraD [candidate division KSB1 bacterium]
MSNYDDIRQRVYNANMELPRQGVVIYNFGNVSAIDRKERIVAIKPSGVMYDLLKAEDIVILDLAGNIIAGDLKPSSDTKTHLVLYEKFPTIGGIVHTHSPYAVAWSQAARPLPVYGTTHADQTHLDIPCTAFMDDAMIQGDYEEETGHQIVKTFATLSYEEVQMVLVAGHGPFTWGQTPEKAVLNAVVLEALAKMAFLTEQINPNVDRLKETLIQKHYQRKHGPNAYYGQG